MSWREMDSAPDNEVIIGLINGDECPMVWSEHRVCMLGPRAGERGAGWATPRGGDTDPNLPLDEPTAWKPLDSAQESK